MVYFKYPLNVLIFKSVKEFTPEYFRVLLSHFINNVTFGCVQL